MGRDIETGIHFERARFFPDSGSLCKTDGRRGCSAGRSPFCSDLGISATRGGVMLAVVLGTAFVMRQFWGLPD
jgi:hypothetical protein